jgi:transposase InsO family protein
VAKTAKVLGVSRSGYYAWKGRKASTHENEDRALAKEIMRIFKEHKGRYGSPRVWEELKGLGWRVSRKRVERLMREQGFKARLRRKWVKTTESRHSLPVAENLLNREFEAGGPGEKWVSDITYLRAGSGWMYLTVIIDLWDRKVIGWAMSESLAAKNVCLAFIMACHNRPPREGLLFHSDRGVQYCSEEFRRTLVKYCPTVRQSMSRKGNCWDNACAESFFKTLKEEMGTLGRRYNRKQVQTAVFEYIEIYYNRCRRHSAIGYATPVALTNSFAA